jgi:hypothetical protein
MGFSSVRIGHSDAIKVRLFSYFQEFFVSKHKTACSKTGICIGGFRGHKLSWIRLFIGIFSWFFSDFDACRGFVVVSNSFVILHFLT